MNLPAELIKKYDIPGPRYTSYPTVPYWENHSVDSNSWKQHVQRAFHNTNSSEGLSIYIHLPFCESLCTFCACHKQITKKHSVESPYIEALLREWQLYLQNFNAIPVIKEIHLGGGTPTFFHPDKLAELLDGICNSSTIHQDFAGSFEAHPNSLTKEHLKIFFARGFRRLSVGVQDYDPTVQTAINRRQPFELVRSVTELAREIGFNSISHDLVFGLPHQTPATIADTIAKTNSLKPDRIAFYSYAHVPWIKGVGQRGFDESDLPRETEKRVLYETGKSQLYDHDYNEIGMDHFALKTDSLFEAMKGKRLHRNFMGYTPSKTTLMVGLGMSAISDSWDYFAQNAKSVKEYQEQVATGILPVYRGHKLNQEDLIIRRHILELTCNFETSWIESDRQFPDLHSCIANLAELSKDGLVEISDHSIRIPDFARPFIRNICMAFDVRLRRNEPTTQIFSNII